MPIPRKPFAEKSRAQHFCGGQLHIVFWSRPRSLLSHLYQRCTNSLEYVDSYPQVISLKAQVSEGRQKSCSWIDVGISKYIGGLLFVTLLPELPHWEIWRLIGNSGTLCRSIPASYNLTTPIERRKSGRRPSYCSLTGGRSRKLTGPSYDCQIN